MVLRHFVRNCIIKKMPLRHKDTKKHKEKVPCEALCLSALVANKYFVKITLIYNSTTFDEEPNSFISI